jgi:putative heme-binding domain-containing protein
MGKICPSPAACQRNRVRELIGAMVPRLPVTRAGDWRGRNVAAWMAVLLGGVLLLPPGGWSAPPSSRVTGALKVAVDKKGAEGDRVAAVRRLGRAEYQFVSKDLFALLEPRQPEALRLAVIRTLTQISEPLSVAPLMERWSDFSPAVRQAVLHAFTTRRVLAAEFLAQLGEGALPLAEVDTATRKRFENLSDGKLAKQSVALFQRQPLMNARARFAEYRGVLELKGHADRGRVVFRERSCFNCHRLGGEGVFVGADLFTVKDMPRYELLRNILSPNLFFMPNFQVFVAEDEDGELVEGLLAGSNSVTVTLRRALGDETVLHRKSVKRLKGLNVSLMPEGLLQGLTNQQVADLLEFIQSSKGDEGVGLAARNGP